MQAHRDQRGGGDQKIQIVRGGSQRQENNCKIGQGPEGAGALECRQAQGGLQEKGDRIFSVRVRQQQPARSS